MENSISLDSVSDDEVVIRYLKKRYYDVSVQQWSTDTFELRQDESSISVCRKALLSSEGKTIIGVPTNPAYYNLQGKLLELALTNIKSLQEYGKLENNEGVQGDCP